MQGESQPAALAGFSSGAEATGFNATEGVFALVAGSGGADEVPSWRCFGMEPLSGLEPETC